MAAAKIFTKIPKAAFILLSLSSFAAELCSSSWLDFQNKLKASENRLAFRNDEGPLGIGLCWWHSRMQRNANFLLDFRPSLPKLTGLDLWMVIRGLAGTGHVMAVTGYANLEEFSKAHASELKETLAQWQLADTFLGFNWVNGLQGDPQISPGELEEKMERLYERVKIENQVVYQMLNFPGISSHALLVVDMFREANGDIIFAAVDSNFATLQYFTYRRGAGRIESRYGGFVPYVQRSSDLADFQRVIAFTCDVWGTPSHLTAPN